jgi:hypothetical protein
MRGTPYPGADDRDVYGVKQLGEPRDKLAIVAAELDVKGVDGVGQGVGQELAGGPVGAVFGAVAEMGEHGLSLSARAERAVGGVGHQSRLNRSSNSAGRIRSRRSGRSPTGSDLAHGHFPSVIGSPACPGLARPVIAAASAGSDVDAGDDALGVVRHRDSPQPGENELPADAPRQRGDEGRQLWK